MSAKAQVIMAFCFGCAAIIVVIITHFLVALVGSAFPPAALSGLLDTLQLVLAMALAGVASAIPGFLEVLTKIKIPERWNLTVRAGGALAVFVLVLVLRPVDGIKNMVDYNRLLTEAKNQVQWNRYSTVNGPGINAFGLCNQLIAADPSRWEGYFCLARYHFLRRDYDRMSDSVKRTLLAMARRDVSSNLTEEVLKKLPVESLDAVEVLRNLGLAELGRVRRSGGDAKLGMIAFREAIRYAEELSFPVGETLIDLRWDFGLLRVVDWYQASERAMKNNALNIESDWSNFIRDGLDPYPVAWAYYMRAGIRAKVLELTPEQSASDKNRLSQLIAQDVRRAVEGLEEFRDARVMQRDWMLFYLFAEGEQRDPRANDPIIFPELRRFIISDVTLTRELRAILGRA